MIVLGERAKTGGQTTLGPAGQPYKRSPPAPIFCRQASLSVLYLCAQVFVPKTTVDIANLPKLDSSNNSHP
jgi:hypothetical protein